MDERNDGLVNAGYTLVNKPPVSERSQHNLPSPEQTYLWRIKPSHNKAAQEDVRNTQAQDDRLSQFTLRCCGNERNRCVLGVQIHK